MDSSIWTRTKTGSQVPFSVLTEVNNLISFQFNVFPLQIPDLEEELVELKYPKEADVSKLLEFFQNQVRRPNKLFGQSNKSQTKNHAGLNSQ